MSGNGVRRQWRCLSENLQLLEKRDLHQGKKNLVHLYLNRAGLEGVSYSQDPPSGHEKCKYLSVQGYVSKVGRLERQ